MWAGTGHFFNSCLFWPASFIMMFIIVLSIIELWEMSKKVKNNEKMTTLWILKIKNYTAPEMNSWCATVEIWSGTLRDEHSRETIPYRWLQYDHISLLNAKSHEEFIAKTLHGTYQSHQILHKDIECRIRCIIIIQHVWNTIFKHPAKINIRNRDTWSCTSHDKNISELSIKIFS